MTEASLTPWSPLERAHGERPAALLALGLTRAWLHLDHIVWRVFAHPEPAEPADRLPGGHSVVRLDDGSEYQVIDVTEALASVPPLHTPPVRPRLHTPPVAVPAAAEHVAPAVDETTALAPLETTVEAPVSEPVAPTAEAEAAFTASDESSDEAPMRDEAEAGSEAGAEPALEAEPELLVLDAEFVRPLARVVEPAAAEPEIAPEPEAEPEPEPQVVAPEPQAFTPEPEAEPEPEPQAAGLEPAVATPAESAPHARVRRALVVDDSLVAQMAVSRVFEAAGYRVESVGSADEMWRALPEGPWDVVLADVFLPDASGRAHLRSLVAQQLAAAHRFELVALTRDAGEEQLVIEAGITRILRKPFRPGALEQFVRELPAPPARA